MSQQAGGFVPNTSQFECKVSQLATSANSFQQCRKIRQEQSSRGRLPLSPSRGPKQAGNTRATCRGTGDRAIANPSAHKRMTGKRMLDVFGGPGFLAKATNHLGLRGYVLDTRFGPRYDVTKPLVIARIRQDVSAGKCVAGMVSPPRQHTSYSSKVISASASIANLLHRARMPWILEHPCDSWLWDVPKNPDSCGAASHGQSPSGCLHFWISMQQASVVSGWKRGQQRFAPYCTQVCWDGRTLQCNLRRTCPSKGFRLTLRVLLFT